MHDYLPIECVESILFVRSFMRPLFNKNPLRSENGPL